MGSYPTGLIFRTWKVLQSGDLHDISPKLTTKAQQPLPDFFLNLLASPAIHALTADGIAINGDEFLMYVSSEEGGPLDCIVTNRKLIFFASQKPVSKVARKQAKEHGPGIEARSCLFASVTSVSAPANSSDSTHVVIDRKRGNPLTLDFASESSTAAIRFAAPRFGEYWDSLHGGNELAELEEALQRDEFAASAQQSAGASSRNGPVAAKVKVKSWTRKTTPEQIRANAPNVEQEEETLGSILADMIPIFVGFGAFVIFLMANGAPIFDGGPAVMRWLSHDNSGYLYGAIVAGILAAFFWPKKK